jgi:signal peptidase II
MTEPANKSTADPDPAADKPRLPMPPPLQPRRRRLPALTFALAILVLAVDQGSKYLAVQKLTDRGRVDVIGSLFGLQLTRNAGAAFSTATGATWLLTLVAIAVVIVIIRISRRLGSWGWAAALGFLLGGALGNLTDRLVRPPGIFEGHVIDFLEFPHWPIFNLADSSITVAAVLIALLSLAGIGIDGNRVSGSSASSGRASSGSVKSGLPKRGRAGAGNSDD